MADDRPLAGVRVLHLSTVHRVTDPRIRLKECQTLADAGATVRFVARSSPVEVEANVDNDVEAVVLPTYERRFDRVWKGQRDVLRAVREFKPDVVHFHDPELLAIAPALKRLAPSVIYDVHESLPDLVLDREWIPAAGRKVVSAICRRVEPLLARACSAYVFVDQRWAQRFADRPWIELTNPPLAGEFPATDRSAPPTPPHFVYIGELLAERGVHGAVQAVNRLEGDMRLTMAGPVSDSLAAELRELDTYERLDLPGLVDRPTVQRLLASATAGLVLLKPVPAYDDATATKIHEYMASGLPLVLSDTSAHRRISTESGAAQVVPYDDVDKLRDALLALIDDPALWQSQSTASLAAASQATTWESIAPELVDLYTAQVAALR